MNNLTENLEDLEFNYRKLSIIRFENLRPNILYILMMTREYKYVVGKPIIDDAVYLDKTPCTRDPSEEYIRVILNSSIDSTDALLLLAKSYGIDWYLYENDI